MKTQDGEQNNALSMYISVSLRPLNEDGIGERVCASMCNCTYGRVVRRQYSSLIVIVCTIMDVSLIECMPPHARLAESILSDRFSILV